MSDTAISLPLMAVPPTNSCFKRYVPRLANGGISAPSSHFLNPSARCSQILSGRPLLTCRGFGLWLYSAQAPLTQASNALFPRSIDRLALSVLL